MSLSEIPSSTLERAATTPPWARWNSAGDRWYTVGAEEEVMLLNPADHSLAQRSDEALT